jgi:hypothetical protein
MIDRGARAVGRRKGRNSTGRRGARYSPRDPAADSLRRKDVPALPLTLAIGDYDHVRDLALGVVRPEGIDLNVLNLPVEEIFFRFTKHREWDVSEMSFAKVVSLLSQDDRSIVPLPVFVSRVFRLSSIYVRPDGPVKAPADLRGKRIGVPEWAQTAAIYSRGYLVHELGIPLAAIEWVQAGVNESGRVEKVALNLPPDVRLQRAPDKTLNGMLLAGELDAVLSARPPQAFAAGQVARLYPEYRAPGSDRWEKISWDDALTRVAKVLKEDRDKNFIERNKDGQLVNRWTSTGFLAASATTNETAYLTYKVVRSMGMVVFDNQARV